MSLIEQMELARDFLDEYSSDCDDEFGSVVKRIQGMSYEAEDAFVDDARDEYINLFDRLVDFAGEEHQATDKILPSIDRVRDVFTHYTPPWNRPDRDLELTI